MAWVGLLRQGAGKFEAVARLVLRRQQAADDFFAHMLQRRLDADAAIAVEDFIGNAIGGKRLDVLARGVELGLCPEQLQRALHALVVGNAGFCAQCGKRNAAIVGEPQHAALADRIALRRAIRKHLDHPANPGGIDFRAQDQRRVLHEQPLHCLHWDAGCRPGRAIAERDFAGIGKARFQRRSWLTVNDRHVMSAPGKLIGRGDADDAGAENNNFHDFPIGWEPTRLLAIVPKIAVAEAGQDLVRNCACVARDVFERLMLADDLTRLPRVKAPSGRPETSTVMLSMETRPTIGSRMSSR